MELGGKVHITCAKTGYNASVTFHTKPFYGGKLHRVTGEVKNTSTGRVICKVNGEWNGKIELSFTSHQVCVVFRICKDIFSLEQVSFECRKTKAKVFTLTNHNSRKQSNKPIRARSKNM